MVRIAVELLGALVAVVVLLVVVAAWRLSDGPVRTNFLTPYLQAAVNEAGGNTIGIGGTFLVWEGAGRGLVMHASGISVRDPQGRLIASLPEVAFGLSSSALLDGTLAPDEIELIAPRIRLQRDPQGRITFGEEAAAGAAADVVPREGSGEDIVLSRVVHELMARREPGNPLSYLDEVRVRDAQVFMRDERLHLSWAAPAADIAVRRDARGLAGDISLAFAGARDPANLDLAFVFDKGTSVVDLVARFSDISLANLATALPQLAPVGGVTSRITGSVYTSLSVDGVLGHTGFELSGFAGTLAIPGLDMDPVPVRDLTMRGRYDSEASRFQLDESRVRLGTEEAAGPVLTVAGAFDYDPLDSGWSIDADAKLEDVAVADLAAYWPRSVAPGARPWVAENVTGGHVEAAAAELHVTVPNGDFEASEVTGLSGTMRYRGVEVHYLRPLEPVQALAGTATFDLDSLRFDVQSGSRGGIAIGPSSVDITGFATADAEKAIYEQLKVNAEASGPVRDALAILDHPRLDLLSELGISAEGSSGSMTADLVFQFPLSKHLDFDDVTLDVAARVKDGGLRNVLLDQDMTDAGLDVSVHNGGMELSGPLSLGGVPLTVRWQESFAASPTLRSVVEAEIHHIDDAARARFGLDIGDAVQGPISGTVSMTRGDDGGMTLQVAADLVEAVIALPEVHWHKAPGTAGSLSLAVDLHDERPVAYRDIVLQAGDLMARGKATPGPDGEGFSAIALQRVAFGRSDLTDVAVALERDRIDVAIGAGTLDAEPFLAADAAATDRTEPDPRPRDFQPLSIRAPQLRTLYFAGDRRLEQVNLDLRRVRSGWETIRLSGSIPEQYWSPREAKPQDPQEAGDAGAAAVPPEFSSRYVQLSYAPDAVGSGQRLLAQSDDLGALLRATDITDTVVGGRIEVTGHSDGPTPSFPIIAKVQARDFVLVDAPVLARLLTVASFTGVLDILRGDGIGFEGMDGEFVLNDGLATTELMRIYGPALGLTARGQIDFDKDEIALTGVVVPAYTINNFISKIPLLGPLLTGGEGEGLIAMVYNVQGEVDDPDVSVNPLSALTPGFLRNIFTLGQPGDEPPQALPWKDRIDR